MDGTSRPGAARSIRTCRRARRKLHFASRHVTSIEINSTFYGAQKPATFANGATTHRRTSSSPSRRRCSPRIASASSKARRACVDSWRAASSSSATSWGRSIWQLAPTKRFDAEELSEFLALLPAQAEGRKLRHALGVRHESFDHPEFVALMRERGVAIVEAGDASYPRIAANTAPFHYLRLMGNERGGIERLSGAHAHSLENLREEARLDGRCVPLFHQWCGRSAIHSRRRPSIAGSS